LIHKESNKSVATFILISNKVIPGTIHIDGAVRELAVFFLNY